MVLKLLQKYHHILIIITIACLIVFPRRSGYVMLLDFMTVPEYSWQFFDPYGGLAWIAVDTIGLVFWGIILQYVVMLGALISLWLWAYYVIKEVKIDILPWAHRSGIIFMMINPFLYARMVEGQYGVYGWYALLLWACYFLYRRYKKGVLSDWIGWVVLAGLTVSLSYHALFFVGLVSTLVLISSYKRWKNILYRIGSMIAILIINFNRIRGSLFLKTWISQTLQHIDTSHITSFQTQQGNVGILYQALSLHGFRWEVQGRFITPFSLNPYWIYIFGLLFLLVVYGYYRPWKSVWDKTLAIWLWSVAIISYILALGISGPWLFADLTQWLYDYIPYYIGLREPQKWLWILMIIYAVGLALWWHKLYTKVVADDPFFTWPLRILLLFLPIVYTPTMLFALKGQLKVFSYPQEYVQAKEYIYRVTSSNESCQSEECFDLLVLPWHQYMSLTFTNKIAPNPWEKYFQSYDDKYLNVLIGDNMELSDIYTQSSRPASKIIERYVHPSQWLWTIQPPNEADSRTLCTNLNILGIYGILLMKELERQRDKQYLDALVTYGYASLDHETTTTFFYRLNCWWLAN